MTARLAEVGMLEVEGVPIIAAPWMLDSGRVTWKLRDARVAAERSESAIGEDDGQLQP